MAPFTKVTLINFVSNTNEKLTHFVCNKDRGVYARMQLMSTKITHRVLIKHLILPLYFKFWMHKDYKYKQLIWKNLRCRKVQYYKESTVVLIKLTWEIKEPGYLVLLWKAEILQLVQFLWKYNKNKEALYLHPDNEPLISSCFKTSLNIA